MKKLVIILSIFVVLLGGGIYFILPSNINWDDYIKEAAKAVKERTGLTMTVQGKPQFSMPVLKLGQVRIGNVRDGSYPEMMTAARAEILFDTGSLFRRKIKIKKITLFSPQLYFETMPDGKWNWQIAFFDRAQAETIGFDSLLLTNGVAEVKTDKYTPPQKWDRVNAEMFADSIQGPFFFEGNFGALSSSFGFSLKVEKFLKGQSPNFSLRLINAPAEASFVLSGTYGLTETDRGIMSGGLTFDIRKPDQFFALLYPQEKLPPSLFQPVVGNLKLHKSAQTRTTELTEILFKYGTSSASGKMSVRSLSAQEASSLQAQEEQAEMEDDDIVLRDPKNPSQAVSLDNTPVRQTKLAANLLPKVVDGSFIFSKFDADPFFDNLPVIADFLAKTEYFSRTKDTYAFDVMFDVVNYKKDVIHQMKSKIKSTPEGLSFKDFSATLPSNAYITGQADLKLEKPILLSGDISAETDNISAVLNWLGLPLPNEIPQTLLHQFKAQTEFKLAKNGVVLQKIKGNLDQINFSGNMALRLGSRKALSVTADVSEMNFAQYFPEKSKAFVQHREEFAQLSKTEKVQKLFNALSGLNNMDLSVNLKTKAFSWADINAENLNADFSVVRGQMKINEMSAEKVLASSIKLQGEAEGFGSEPKLNNFSVKIDAQQLSSLTQALGFSLPRNVSVQDKMLLSAKLTGSLQSLMFDTDVDFGILRFSAKGNIRQAAPDIFDWNAETDIYHENFRNFIRLFSDGYRPVLANPGAMRLKANILKNKDLFTLTDMTAQVGDNELKGHIKVTNNKGLAVIAGELESQDFAPLAMLPRVNFVDTVSVDTQKNTMKNVWTTDGVLTDFASNLSFSKKTFDFSFLGKYEANIALKAKNLILNSFILSDVDSVIKVTSNKITIDIRRSLWDQANFGGIFNLMPTADGKLSVGAALRVSNLNIPAKLFISDTLNLSALENVVLNANINATGKSTDELFSSLEAKGSFSFEKADLNKLNMNQFGQDMRKMFDLSEETIIAQALEGNTELRRLSATLSAKDGLLALEPIAFVYNGNENKASFSYNYLNQLLSTNISFLSGQQEIPNISLSVNKKADQPAVLEQNLQKIVSEAKALYLAQKEKIQEQQEQLRQQELAAAEKARNERVEKLKKLDEQLTVAAAELTKRIGNITPFSQRVYQVQKYVRNLSAAATTLNKLTAEIQKVISQDGSVLTDTVVSNLEKKVQDEYFKKEAELNSDYNTAMIVGTKGMIFDVLNQSNEILRQEAKLQTTHSDLTEISENTKNIMQEIESVKVIQKKSEGDAVGLEELTVLRAQAESVLEKIKTIHQKTLDAVDRKKAEIEAKEKAKKAAEELKKKQEEEAKKAAEAAAAAEKAKKEAEERERQRTIFRLDGDAKPSSPKTSAPVLQNLTVQKTEEKAEEKKEDTGTIIIRRR